MKAKSVVITILNILISFLILTILFILIFMCPRDWLYTEKYSDNVALVIRSFSAFEIILSIIFGLLNKKKKIVLGILFISNLFTIYKAATTFI